MLVSNLNSVIKQMLNKVKQLALLLCLVSMPVVADKINFIGIDSPPYSYLQGDQPSGLNVEWIDQVRQQLPYRSDVYVYPLKRAMYEVKGNNSSVLFGLARTPEREADFRWVAPMYDVEIGHVTISKPRQLGHKYRAKYCVHSGSPMEKLLAEQGEQDVIALLTDERCLAMLEQGMISVWFTAFNVAKYLAQQHQVAELLKFGKKVKSVSLYVAVAKDYPEQNLDQLEQICQQAEQFSITSEIATNRKP